MTAVVLYRLGGDRDVHHVVGHNGEACALANSCCAERAAFLQCGGIFAPRGLEVCAVYLTSDAPHAITPGALCREYVLEAHTLWPASREHD